MRGVRLSVDVDVAELRCTQRSVSCSFRQGPHGGMSVLDLSQSLLRGIVDVRDITPLVAVKLNEKTWVVHGNRRLFALKEFQRVSGQCVRARCIVHDPSSHRGVPHQVLAKLILHASTQTDGLSVKIGGSRRA